jgi:hypothetical protein
MLSGGQKKKKKKLSPILDQIMNGGPSTALNLSRVTRAMTEGTPFFETSALNRCIIFKYPNFSVEIGGEASTDYNAKDSALSEERPVETAIYIPNDEEFLQDGGYAIYIRQKGSEQLLQRYVSVSADANSQGMINDLAKLKTIDEIPSLDPFLLKTAFERDKIEVDPAYLAVGDKEEQAIKRVISDKVRPIVSKALGFDAKGSNDKSQRFIDAIWDPNIPEAGLFIEAFKIDKSEVANVFSAWKGVSFYQYQFSRNRALIAEILKWFKSEQSIPIDFRQNKHFAEQQNMFKTAIQKRMIDILSNINQVFKDFDGCYANFIDDGDPIPFRNFLVTSHFRYWILGYCCTSLSHCRNIFERYMETSIKGQLTFEQTAEMLTNMDGTLSSQSSMSSDLE